MNWNIEKKDRILEVKIAIYNVLKKRKIKGIRKDQKQEFVEHLKYVWRNNNEILDYIDEMDLLFF